jgi:hypothetical protein
MSITRNLTGIELRTGCYTVFSAGGVGRCFLFSVNYNWADPGIGGNLILKCNVKKWAVTVLPSSGV